MTAAAARGAVPGLLRWLAASQPDVVVLQELKAPQEKFPEAAIRDLATTPSGTGGRAGTASRCRAASVRSTRRGAAFRATPTTTQSRYIEAALNGILIGGLCIPTERDVCKPVRWLDDALFAFEVREALFRPSGQGRTDALPALVDRLVDAQAGRDVRGREMTSDHAPVWVALADNPRRRRAGDG